MNGAANTPQMVLVWRGDNRSVSFAEEEQSTETPIITATKFSTAINNKN
jgi:hypothetical protein